MMQSKPRPPAVSIFHEQNQMRGDDSRPPDVPTMTNATILEPPPLREVGAPPEELAEDIVAKPLTLPEFASDIQPYLANQGLSARWIFTDRRRYMQAKAQGWRNCTERDLKPGYAKLNPFSEEGGTKYINGDLILMVMDRKRYLGALRYKHEVAFRLSQAVVQRQISANKARQELGPQINRMNEQRARSGHPPVMSVFDPDKNDLNEYLPEKEINRLGNQGKVDTGKLSDLTKKEEK